MPRLFLAVWPPPEVVEALRQLPRAGQAGIRWVPEANWHVTMRFLGQAAPEDAVGAMRDAGRLPGAVAEVGPAVRTLGPSVVMVPVAGLDRLAAAVRDATAEVGDPPDPRPFSGHLTLARRRDRARSRLVGARVEATFAVTELTLVESRQVKAGVEYHTLERFGLALGPSPG